MALLVALVVWFAAAFLLGSRFRFRHALEVTCWAGLVKVPANALFFWLASRAESLRDVHLGLGALIPVADEPTRLLRAVTVFLDLLGPFEVWWFVVGVLGVVALSGLPRRQVAVTLGSLYLGLGAVVALVTGLSTPSS
jgi:hypothetical protein